MMRLLWRQRGVGPLKFSTPGCCCRACRRPAPERTGGYGSAVLPPLTGKLRPKPENIGPMALRSKEPAPEERGDVKFLHAGLLLLLGQPEASSGKEQAAAGAQQSRC